VALTVPLLIDPNDVILRMQVNASLDGVLEVITSAIAGAQLAVQALIDGSLAFQARTNLFFLDSEAFSGLQPGGFFRLEIPSGFIRTDTPVVITFDDTWTLANAEVADPTLYSIDYLRGYILMDAVTYADQYVQVACTTGFNASVPTPAFTGPATTYDPTVSYLAGAAVMAAGMTYVCIAPTTNNTPPNVLFWTPVQLGPEVIPSPVYEAIMSYVPTIFDASQTTNRNQEAQAQYKKAGDHAMMLLKPFMRLKGFSFRPNN
jgi:hypothetical protein